MFKSLFFIILATGSVMAQAPIFGPNAMREGYACVVWSSTGADTSKSTGQLFFTSDYEAITGAVTLAGYMQVSAGADTLTTIKVRLIMKRYGAITYATIYDTSAAHTLIQQSGDYIPVEDDVNSSGVPFSIELANQTWWKPCVGIEIQFIHYQKSGMTKKIEAYLILNKYQLE